MGGDLLITRLRLLLAPNTPTHHFNMRASTIIISAAILAAVAAFPSPNDDAWEEKEDLVQSKLGVPYVCAQEHQTCKCTGSVIYGKKYANTKGNSGADATYQQKISSPYKQKTVTGSIGCNNGVFGDPLVGAFKSCLCYPGLGTSGGGGLGG